MNRKLVQKKKIKRLSQDNADSTTSWWMNVNNGWNVIISNCKNKNKSSRYFVFLCCCHTAVDQSDERTSGRVKGTYLINIESVLMQKLWRVTSERTPNTWRAFLLFMSRSLSVCVCACDTRNRFLCRVKHSTEHAKHNNKTNIN